MLKPTSFQLFIATFLHKRKVPRTLLYVRATPKRRNSQFLDTQIKPNFGLKNFFVLLGAQRTDLTLFLTGEGDLTYVARTVLRPFFWLTLPTVRPFLPRRLLSSTEPCQECARLALYRMVAFTPLQLNCGTSRVLGTLGKSDPHSEHRRRGEGLSSCTLRLKGALELALLCSASCTSTSCTRGTAAFDRRSLCNFYVSYRL